MDISLNSISRNEDEDWFSLLLSYESVSGYMQLQSVPTSLERDNSRFELDETHNFNPLLIWTGIKSSILHRSTLCAIPCFQKRYRHAKRTI